ncbi:MAG: thiolase family protein, partial [Planctomycetota bacterium]
MPEAVIVSSARTAVGRSGRGTLRRTRPEDLAAETIKEVIKRTEGFDPAQIEDVIIGTSYPEREQGTNIGRIAALKASLPPTVPGVTVNRFCSSGLQTIAQAAERIIAGGADVILAGGVESMSCIPLDASLRLVPNPGLAESWPDVYLNMGLTAENVATKYNISRENADKFSFQSHQKAAAAIDKGNFKNEIFPFKLSGKIEDGKGGFVEQD